MSKPTLSVPAPENFPALEKVFAEGQLEPFRKRLSERRAKLKELAAAKDGEGRRAAAALAAYELGAALIDRIEEIRQAAATSAASPR